MGDSSETETELRRALDDLAARAVKSRALSHLAGGIAHDLNNALQTIVGSLTTIEKLIEMDQLERAPRFIAAASRSAQRGGELTRILQRLARRKPDGPNSVELNPLLLSLEDLFRRICGERCALQLNLDERAGAVNCDPGELEAVLLTLMINATEASDGNGAITVATHEAQIDLTGPQSFDWEFAGEFAGRCGGRAFLEGTTVSLWFPSVMVVLPESGGGGRE
jgi:C4-dicarboxylate-specific signal transduction histidine kinase